MHERHYMKYTQRNTVPVCLQTVRMSVWDKKDMLIKKPELVEDPELYERRLHNILTDAKAFSYANRFPPNENKRSQSPSLQPLPCLPTPHLEKIEIFSDDDDKPTPVDPRRYAPQPPSSPPGK